MTVGIRNLFGRGEKLDVIADIGINTTNQYSLNAIHNTSNEYSVMLTQPRILLPKYLDPLFYLDNFRNIGGANPTKNKSRRIGPAYKYSMSWRGFKQSLDRSRSSSYKEESTGATVNLISPNKEHVLSYHGHFRSLIISPRQTKDQYGGTSWSDVSSSIGDEQVPSFKSSFNYRFTKDTRDHMAIPTTGYYATAEAELAGMGGDVDFIKCMGGFQYHWSLPINLPAILNVGIRSGVVFPWKQLLRREGDGNVRIVDRIIPFAGLQCRGYNHAQIGPCHNKDYIHCDYLVNGGISLTFPIFDWLYGNLFGTSICCGLLDKKFSMEKLLDDQHGSAGASLVIPFMVGRFEIGYAIPFQRQNDPFQGKPFWSFDVSFL